jgi:hypothetical protein
MKKIKDTLKRSIGVIMFAFIPGMAAGSPTVGWFMGGVIGVATVFSGIIIYLGVTLAWDADISSADIEKGFRAAVAKQDTQEVKDALKLEQMQGEINWDEFGSDDDPELEEDPKA